MRGWGQGCRADREGIKGASEVIFLQNLRKTVYDNRIDYPAGTGLLVVKRNEVRSLYVR